MQQQVQIRLAATVDDAAFVVVVFGLFAGRNRWTVAHQAHQQQHVSKAALFGQNANIDHRVQVKQTHLHVFNTVGLQSLGRALAQFADAFGANAGVKLVFNLQQVSAELLPVAVRMFHTQLGVIRIWCANRSF